MKDPLTRLTEKTATLGNYNRKYLHIISSNIEKLTDSLEQKGLRDQVHLWSYSSEYPGEMDSVLEAASDPKERLDFLGCYFALQFLHMNLHTVDIVKLDFAEESRQWIDGRKIMIEAGRKFRYLTKNYMERLLLMFLGKDLFRGFAILGVGTRADQDDIDLGIICRGEENRDKLNGAIARLSTEMLKKASRLHFHLSEHVGRNSLVATIEDYETILDRGMYDFVIVNEMLGAAVILGDQRLFEEFRSRVTDRFYSHGQPGDNRYHEAYLRGILGEITSLLTRPRPVETICPKDDALRPIKSLLSAMKLVHGVRKENAWNIIDELREKDGSRAAQYAILEKTLSFYELLRHLYQITVAQDEEIPLDQPGIVDMVARIAEMIGYEKKGVVTAREFLLVNYYEFLDETVDAIDTLASDLKKHLHEISVFRPIFSLDSQFKVGYDGNLALDFIRATGFFKGITYWDDFLEELADENSVFYEYFVKSFMELPVKIRSVIARAYMSGIGHDINPSVRFLAIVGRRAETEPGKEVFEILSGKFIDALERMPEAQDSVTRAVHSDPELVNSLMAMLNWKSLERLSRLASMLPTLPELMPYHPQLLTLCEIHCGASQFFKRHFLQIFEKYPVYIRNIHKNDKLKEITGSFYSDLGTPPTIAEQIELLGDYYDLEFVRVSLMAMAGISCDITDMEFTEFCDNYALALYELCQKDVHLSLGYSMHTRDLFALYATGGHAREQGFDDDYDMIVILDSDDQEQIDFCNRIVGRMNSEILKRGILPHHRFSDHFGSYVMTFEQLSGHLQKGEEETFIDQAQILASRMLVGTGKLENKLQHEIIAPMIFDKGELFVEELKKEMRSRHGAEAEEKCGDIKECRGGLRDIEMLLLMYKTRHRVRDPLSRKFLRKLREIEPERADDFKLVEEHLNFIKNLRDLYRLKVAAHNVIEPDYLASVASTMGYGNDEDSGLRLYEEFQRRSEEAAIVIDRLTELA